VIGERGYCSHTCTVAQDCVDLQQAIPNIVLAQNLWGANHWNARSLHQAVLCADLAAMGNETIGAADGASWCALMCPEHSAIIKSPDGTLITGCGCWPNFRKDASKQGLVCNWDPSIECSIFSPCTRANTQVAACSAGDFSCVVNDHLEGVCFDKVSGNQIEQCIAKCRWDCDPECLANTCAAGAEDACTRACCNSTDPACR
jgi:hypothetical protein